MAPIAVFGQVSRPTMRSRRVLGILLVLMTGVLSSTGAGAQGIDLSGEWNVIFHWDYPERLPGPELGDYLGLPINDAARLKAESWDASVQTLPERQCIPHSADYMWGRAAFAMRVWKEMNMATQEVVAWHMLSSWQNQHRIIYMDGRAHPSSNALHAWQGFSTGTWVDGALMVATTHLKMGYLRRNGVPRSDLATLTEQYIRHGNYLRLLSIIDDPAYLTEPLTRTATWALDLNQHLEPYPCEVAEEIDRPVGVVPHHLPGTNADLQEFPARYGLPERAANGGAETMYPEYRLDMRKGGESPGRVAAGLGAASRRPDVPAESVRDALELLPVRGNVYMLAGAGGNITVQVGNDGVLLVDSGVASATDHIVAALKRLSDRTIRYIIDTHVHPDHIGGNEALAKLGSTIAGGDVANLAADAQAGAAVLAHQAVLTRMSQEKPLPAFLSLPTDTYVGSRKDLFFNDEAVLLLHPAAAHTDGDSMVFFRRSDVIVTGDVFNVNSYPVIDLVRGGSIQGELDALNQILRFAVSGPKEEGGTLLVPGHGRLCDEADLVEYRDMVTIIRDRIQDLIRKGMSLEQVRAARPTEDYDLRYGRDVSWTPDRFVEAIYQSLTTPARK